MLQWINSSLLISHTKFHFIIMDPLSSVYQVHLSFLSPALSIWPSWQYHFHHHTNKGYLFSSRKLKILYWPHIILQPLSAVSLTVRAKLRYLYFFCHFLFFLFSLEPTSIRLSSPLHRSRSQIIYKFKIKGFLLRPSLPPCINNSFW